MKLSFNLGMVPGVTELFPGDSLSERLTVARAHGFTGVEGPVPARPREVRQQLDAHGMRYACLSFARGDGAAGELGIAGLPGREAEFRDELDRAIEAADLLACDLIHPLAGRVPEGTSRAACWTQYGHHLQMACERAAQAGVQVIVEPICAARQPSFLLNTLAQAHSLAADLPGLKIMVDMFHAALSGESVAAFARSHADSIGMLQVASVPTRSQPSAEDPELLAAVQALRSQGWAGWISAEYVPQGELPRSLDWLRVLA
ncbi:TIM barrel protein [Hydrogenophaga sp.]|uniref:TIM barrel protein n=1 Tax=Hydrogenophaga sp. TaxID=1904254 RepID=UPI00271EDD14|nr:TIM barrel protein [Hydrogenophaga sp.]MDO9436548.1 TIM barrel protein [Hydrogenophaga sp.]